MVQGYSHNRKARRALNITEHKGMALTFKVCFCVGKGEALEKHSERNERYLGHSVLSRDLERKIFCLTSETIYTAIHSGRPIFWWKTRDEADLF